MNLKKSSVNILFKSKRIIAVVIGFTIMAVSLFFLNIYTQKVSEQEQLIEMKNQYNEYYSDYDNAVYEYNQTVNQFNKFLEKISMYNIIDNTTHIPELSVIKKDFEEFRISGADFSAFLKQTEQINNNKKLISSKYYELLSISYSAIIDDYNTLADAYNNLTSNSAVEFIKEIPDKAILKSKKDYNGVSEEDILTEVDLIYNDINKLAYNYKIIEQIINPDEQWVMERLNSIDTIVEKSTVTKYNDPNGKLGQKGGYSGCIYFGLKNIEQSTISGKNIVEKGTDAGGAIEIYPTLEAAKNRCQYLSEFDNTLLYSGSYVIIGTMVIRTSYKLSNEEQIELTNDIVSVFTKV